MTTIDDERELLLLETSTAHFEFWLRTRLHGCAFAQSAVKSERISLNAWPRPLATFDLVDLEGYIDAAAASSQTAIVVFPLLRSDDDIVDLLLTLRRSERWTVTRGTWTNPARQPGVVPVSARWRTSAGLTAEAMGFAPTLASPVTRRAPYAALAVWAGGHENPLAPQPRPADFVGIVDSKTEVSDAKYQARWDETLEETRALCREPYAPRNELQKVAFCVSEPAAARL